MTLLRAFKFILLASLLMISSIGCQSREAYTSPQLGLTIHYPSDWVFEGESEGVIMLLSHYSGNAAIRITIPRTQPTSIDLKTLMEEQLSLWVQESDPNKPIKYGEIQEREHERYLIVTGYVAGHPKIKVSPVDPFFHTYAAAIRSEDRVVFVTATGTGHESPQNAIDEIVEGLVFQ